MDEDVAHAMILLRIPQSLTHQKSTKIDALLVSCQFHSMVYVASNLFIAIKKILPSLKNGILISFPLLSNTLLAIKTFQLIGLQPCLKNHSIACNKIFKKQNKLGFLNHSVN